MTRERKPGTWEIDLRGQTIEDAERAAIEEGERLKADDVYQLFLGLTEREQSRLALRIARESPAVRVKFMAVVNCLNRARASLARNKQKNGKRDKKLLYMRDVKKMSIPEIYEAVRDKYPNISKEIIRTACSRERRRLRENDNRKRL